MSTAKMLATRPDRDRWFRILDRKQCGFVDKADLINYAEKLELTQDKAVELFDRLDSDKDGFLNAQEWDRSGVLLAYEGLVRAENHPIFVAYFKMDRLGVIPRPRLVEIMASKGLNPEILNKPDEMLPLGLGQTAKKPAPATPMPLLEPDSRHLVPKGPSYRSGRDFIDLPTAPFKPAYIRPRPRQVGESPLELPAQPLKWATLAMSAVDEDRPGTLRHAMMSSLFDMHTGVYGGQLGSPFSLGPVYSFYTESQFKDEKAASLERTRIIIKNEGKCRLPKEMVLIEQMALRHARHNGGTDAVPTCMFDHVETGDTLLHLAGRAFSPEVGLVLINKGMNLEIFNRKDQSVFEVWMEALKKFATVPPDSGLMPNMTPGMSKYHSKYSSRASTTANSVLNTSRGVKTSNGSVGVGGAGLSEELVSKVDKRWLMRKSQGVMKLGCLIEMTQTAIKNLTDSLEIIARISEGRLAFVQVSGSELEPWEIERLKAKEVVVRLLEEAHELLEMTSFVNPDIAHEIVINSKREKEEGSRDSHRGSFTNGSNRNQIRSSHYSLNLDLAAQMLSDNVPNSQRSSSRTSYS